jgi:hypothetical protein
VGGHGKEAREPPVIAIAFPPMSSASEKNLLIRENDEQMVNAEVLLHLFTIPPTQ